MAATGTALYIFVVGYIVYFAIAFRARKASDPPDAIGVQIHDNHKLEFWWTIIPVALRRPALGRQRPDLVRRSCSSRRTVIVVEAIGHQFYFSFRYPQINGEVTDEMHLPVNVPVTLNLTSADVIHSFLGAGDAFEKRYGPRPGHDDPVHAASHRTLSDHLHPVLRRACTAEMRQASARHRSPSAVRQVVQRLAASRTRTSATRSPTAAARRSIAPRRQRRRPASRSSARSARRATAGARSIKRIVGPGLKGVLHDPAHPNLVDGDPATPRQRREDPAERVHRQHGQMPNATTNGLSKQDIANLVAYLNSLK